MQNVLEKWASQVIGGIPNLLTAAAIFLLSLYLTGLQRLGIELHKA